MARTRGFSQPSGNMSSRFSQVPRANIPRSRFDRSHGYKTTFDSGYLVPVFADEALPGDTFSVGCTAFARLATPIHPIMDNMYLDTFFFAVPIRLIWDNWQRFNGEQDDPGDSTDYLVPEINVPTDGYDIGSLSDYFGLPTGVDGWSHSALWHRAYNLIYNEWFRDENLMDSVPVPRDDGPDNPADYQLLRRAKRHDYFTSALPWPQKGPSVELPLGDTAPVTGQSTVFGFQDGSTMAAGTDLHILNAQTTANYTDATLTNSTGSGAIRLGIDTDQTQIGPFDEGLVTDLSAATAATINQLREAFQVQRLFERDARGGTRYTEIILSHFGVESPDSRLQRPEYLGGGSTPVNVTPIANTTGTPDAPQGELAGFGTVLSRRNGFHKSFTEHCVVIGLVNVRADLTYQQGLDRMWSRSTRFDFYWPALSHLGEQTILNKEIYTQGTSEDDDVFGYQERYAEYRYKPSRITGLFRSTAPLSLDVWHLSQEFANLPQLNDEFITEDPPVERVIAVSSQPQFKLDAYFQFRAARPMPTYSVPGLIDHF